jgi:nucleoside-diphosphate-sugar epimerase
MSTVLVTGPFGNVGSHTVPELLRRGHTVRTLARLSTANRRAAGRLKVQPFWGDITNPDAVARAVEGVDTVIHLAALIPPGADERPDEARRTNVDGTANVLAACEAQSTKPRLLFTSTFDVHGHTLHKPPPRHVDDPLEATDPYTEHKIECERMIQASTVDWCILRLTDVPVLGARDPHPIMFEIGLDNRIEALHADDAGLALANALETPAVWGRILFVGGGPSCQVTYRQYLAKLLAAMNIEPLPDEAFSTKEYATDWVDSEESQALLRYQRHSFDDIAEAIAASLGWKRRIAAAAGPLARASILRLSAYYRK